VDQTVARFFFDYDPTTGVLSWKHSIGRRKAGTEAGCIGGKGHRKVHLFGADYQTHRVIWLWMTGEWPKQEIDHINRVRDDNRWLNLRDVTRAVNMENKVPRYPGSGVRERDPGRFTAQIRVGKRSVHLGTFGSAEMASAAVAAARCARDQNRSTA